jgi:fatty acid desaturase
VGISYSWWMNKHNRHHANPNKIGKDLDIEADTVSFLEESTATWARPSRRITKGMPIIPADVTPDFLSKQVRTSRNITGGWWATILMGGLNYHIEHHLFPSMPRPHLRAARTLVREHCRSNDVPYVEASLLTSYRTVIDDLNRVGLTARDPFDCPLASRLRPS